MDKSRIIQKWRPVIENIGVKNNQMCDIICLFCENYIITNTDSNDLPEKIKNVLSKLENATRSEVKKTFYNPITGEIEYELENGFTITDKNKFKTDPKIEDLVLIFGIDIVRELDIELFRDYTLDKILP